MARKNWIAHVLGHPGTARDRPEQGRGGGEKRQRGREVPGWKEGGGRALLASGYQALQVHIIMWSLFKVHLASSQSDRLVPEPK